jgi:hypothetical protein
VSISRSSAFVFGGSRGVLCHVVIEKHWIIGDIIGWLIVIGLAVLALMFLGAGLGAMIGKTIVFFRRRK